MFGFKTASSARPNGRVRRSVAAPSSTEHAAWRGFTVTFSPGGVVASVIGLVVVLAWVFFFGIIVGRGLNPETKMPGASILAQADPGQEEPKQEILKPEELTFLKDLKGGNTRRPVGSAPTPQPAAPSEKTQEAPSGAVAAAGDVKTVAPGMPAPAAAQAQAASEQPALPKMAVQDYVFQVVAYKSPAPADALRERLEGAGLRTRMVREKGTGKKATWYRVQVLLRGTEESAAAAKETLARMGIKDAVIVSRKPAGRK